MPVFYEIIKTWSRAMQETQKKNKATVYMSKDIERLLDEVFIKRMRERNKTDRSALLCEGIRLLYEKEMLEMGQ
jgi:hypothetical protein